MGRPRAASQAPNRAVSALKAIDHIATRMQWLAKCLVVFGLLAVAWFALDRDAPFEVYAVEPAQARPGEIITIRANVRRDVDRYCSADMTQFIMDSEKKRFDLGISHASADLITELDRQAPGKLILTMRLPVAMAYGEADLYSSISYRCNKVHALWPIEVTTQIPFMVVP